MMQRDETFQELVPGQKHDVEIRFRAGPDQASLCLVARPHGRPAGSVVAGFVVHFTLGGAPSCLVNGEPAQWRLWAGLPFRDPSDPFLRATSWAHGELFESPAVDPAEDRTEIMRAVYRACRRAAIATAAGCDPALRGLANRFAGHLRWPVYQRLAADPTGRLAQLAAICPGALIFARGLQEHRVARGGVAACDALLDDVVAGRPLKLVLGHALDDWLAQAPEATLLEPELDAVWHRVRTPSNRSAILRDQRLLVQRAPAGVPTTTLWLPPPDPLTPEDIPRGARDRVAWFRTVKLGQVALALEQRLPAAARAPFAGFLSAHAIHLHEQARRRRYSSANWLIRCLLDYAVDRRRTLGRRSDPARVLAASDAWHAALVRGRIAAEDGVVLLAADGERVQVPGDTRLPAPPCHSFRGGDLELRALTTVGEMVAEGQTMRHCLASYVAHAILGRGFYYSGSFQGLPITVELRASHGRWFVAQAVQAGNAQPPRGLVSALCEWLCTLDPPALSTDGEIAAPALPGENEIPF